MECNGWVLTGQFCFKQIVIRVIFEDQISNPSISRGSLAVGNARWGESLALGVFHRWYRWLG